MLTDKPPWWPVWCRCPSWPCPCRWSVGEVAVGSVDRTVPVTSRSAVVPQGALLCMPPPEWGSCSQWSVSVESRSYHFNYSTSHLHTPASHTILVKVRPIHSDQNMDMKNGKNQASKKSSQTNRAVPKLHPVTETIFWRDKDVIIVVSADISIRASIPAVSHRCLLKGRWSLDCQWRRQLTIRNRQKGTRAWSGSWVSPINRGQALLAGSVARYH